MAKGEGVTREGSLVAEPVKEATLVMAPSTNGEGVRCAVEQLHLLKTELGWTLEYSQQADTLQFRAPQQAPAISYFMPGVPEVVFRLDAASGRLTGVDLERFRSEVAKADERWGTLYRQYRLAQMFGRVPFLSSILQTMLRGLQAVASDRVESTVSTRTGLQVG
jgi:hypothetical protein